MRFGRGLSMAVLAGCLGGLWSASASAACYDVFGCSDRNLFRASDLRNGPTCEFLYTMRNTIYSEHGYCFRTPRAIATFGNEGCRFRDINLVPLNRVERANASIIARVEREMGCPP